MKYSIIIPVHNAEAYLAECIDSIFSQDTDDFEVIFVVNGSNDESENICLMAGESHSNVRVIVTDAVGVSYARNRGLREARGEYVVFVDADDRLLPGALSVFTDASADGPDIIAANYIRNKKKRMSGSVSEPDHTDYMKAMLDTPMYYPGRIKLTYQPIVLYCVFAKAFRREFLVNSNIDFDTDIAIGEDILFTLKAAGAARIIRCVDKAVYYYRPGQQTVSSVKDISGVTKRLRSAGKLLDTIGELPDDVRAAAQMKVVDIILRSIVIGSSCGEGEKDAYDAIRAFLRERKAGRLFARARKGSLSMVSPEENIFYMKMMAHMRQGKLAPAFLTAKDYNQYLFKKDQLKKIFHV